MQVQPGLFKKWKTLRSEEDAEKLSKLSGKTPQTIRMILREGKCSDADFKIIADFYDQKAELIKQYL